MQKPFWLILILTVILFSCSKDEEDTVIPDIGHDYAGLEVGNFVIYDVDSLTFDDFNDRVDTAIYQIKEVVDAKFEDLEGEEAFKIIRYRKDADSTGWVLIDVWSSKITQTTFQKVEENIRYLKFIFPVREDKTWNGNALNNEGEVTYEFTAIDQSEIVGGNSLGDVLRVLQFEEINLIEQLLFEEKYAKGVGLVQKKSMNIRRDDLSSPWRGFDITMTLSSYGN